MIALGIDISHYQGIRGMSFARFGRLHAAGVRFMFARASIGEARDRAFVANIARARKQGWVVGAYHFLQPGDVERQAEVFAAAARNLPAWLDVEQSGLTRGHVTRFTRRFRQLRPDGFLGVYSSSSKWRALTGNMDGTELYDGCWNALWTEKGTDERSDLPATEPRPRWGGFRDALIWQYGAFHDAPRRYVDGDAWYGDGIEALRVALGQRPAVPMDERPKRRRAYNDQLEAYRRSIAAALAIPGTGAAWSDGVTDARADVLEAIDGLVLGEPVG